MAWLYKSIVKIALPLVLLLTAFNLMLVAHFHARDTTLIYREIYNRQSDGTSNSGSTQNALGRRGDQSEFVKRPDEEFDSEKAPIDSEVDNPSARNILIRKTNPNEEFPDTVMQDDDVDEMIIKLNSSMLNPFFPNFFWSSNMYDLTHRLGQLTRQKATLLEGYQARSKRNASMAHWRQVHRNIRQFSLYDPDDEAVDALLHDLSYLPMVEAEENDGGTELKLNIRLSDDGRAIMKPKRYDRDVETNPNSYIFDDIERHIAEIAAFKLDRVLGFYRVPPTAGRMVNLTELKELVPIGVKKTFYTSPAGNICFYGQCDYYCNSAHAFCGNPDMLEVSMMSYLPSRNIAPRKSWYQPYRRSYSKFRKAYWETHDDLCDTIRDEPPFNNGKLLFDMIDAHTFDFLTGNKDRHSFVNFAEFNNFTFPIMYDNGRGFGRKTWDAMSILAPLRQCCLIRKSTFLKYVKLYTGPERLSSLMEKALANDPVAPVLIRGHLTALDRRVIKILKEVAICLQKLPATKVIIYDRF